MPIMIHQTLRALTATLLLICVGCGGGDSSSTISGKVTFQGKTVSGGLINFLPSEGQPLGGGIGQDGTYEYQLPPGEYKVRIDTPPPLPEGWKEGDPLPELQPRQVPAKFGRFQTSGLTATVNPQEASQELNFDLE